MMCESPFDHKEYFFIDKCLPFGAAISCAVFQDISNAIAHIVRTRTKKDLVNYLDDFLFVAFLVAWCNGQVQMFLDICKIINFPISVEKTFWSSTTMVFLGFLIDSVKQLVMVPIEKIEKGKDLILQVLDSKKWKVTIHHLQKICSFLNFLGRAIVPGRSFTRRLYMAIDMTLKPHHHTHLGVELIEDLKMWLEFLNNSSVYARSFMDFSKTQLASEIEMFSDAAKNKKLGFGAICQNSWTFSQWDPDFIEDCDPSIEYLELFAVLVGVKNWLHRFQNRRIVLFCNNQSVVHMINKTTSSCKNCLFLI